MNFGFRWGWSRVFVGLSGWLLGAIGPGVLAAVVIPSLFNTGVDDFRRPLAEGAVDPHYQLVLAPGGLAEPAPLQRIADPSPIPTWAASTEASAWLTPGDPKGANREPGAFGVQTTFHLVGLQPSSAVLTGRWWVDDTVLEVRLNGVVQAGLSGGGFVEARAFALTGPFVTGQNVVEFRWVNFGVKLNPTGFRVEWDAVEQLAPVIEVPPQDLTVPEGVAAQLSVVARGAGPLRYQWRRFGDLPGETNAILHREPIQLIHSGLYQVTVSNPFGEVTSSEVRVVVQPVRDLPPNDPRHAPSRLQGEFARVEGSLIRATAEEGDPSPVGGSPNVWWSWQAPDDLGSKPAVVTLTAEGVAFVPVLGVYRRPAEGDWLPVEPEWVYRGYGRRELRFRTGAGENFLVGLALGSERTDQVAGVVPQGDFQLELRCARVGFGTPDSVPGVVVPTPLVGGIPEGLDYPTPVSVAIHGQVSNAGLGGTLPLRVRVLAEPVILDLCDIPDAVPVPDVRELARFEPGLSGLAAGGEFGWEANVECPGWRSVPDVPYSSALMALASQHWRLRLVLEEQLADVWQMRDSLTLLDGPRFGTGGCTTGGGVILLGASDQGDVSGELPRGRLFGPEEVRVGETVEFRGELVFGRPNGVPLVVKLLSADWAIQPAVPGLQIDATGKLQVGDVKGPFEARVSWSKGVGGQVVRVEAPLRVIGVLDPPVLSLPLRVGEEFELQVPAGSSLERSARLEGPWQTVPGTGAIRVEVGMEPGFFRLRR